MLKNKGYLFRLYPNNEQQIYFSKTFGCVRFIYNKILGDRIAYYETTGKTIKPTPASYKEEFSFLKEVDSLALANAQLQVNVAYKNFFEKRTKFPKFKSKKKCKSTYTTNNQKGSISVVDDKYIKLPKIGCIKAKIHCPLPKDSVIKSTTISKTKSGKYYCSVLVEYETTKPIPKPIDELKTLGLDYKSDGFYVDSNGNEANYPKYYRVMENKLKRQQKRLSNKVVGSVNRNKAKYKLAVLHEKVANQRKDYLHKLSRELVNKYNCICVEDINMQNLSRCLKLGKSTHDNGFGMFRIMLKYKLEDEGKQLIIIDKWFPSSKTCSNCKEVNSSLTLKDREWICPTCSAIHNRDINAAINIKNKGLNVLGVA